MYFPSLTLCRLGQRSYVCCCVCCHNRSNALVLIYREIVLSFFGWMVNLVVLQNRILPSTKSSTSFFLRLSPLRGGGWEIGFRSYIIKRRMPIGEDCWLLNRVGMFCLYSSVVGSTGRSCVPRLRLVIQIISFHSIIIIVLKFLHKI